MTKEDYREVVALLNKFYFILENDVPAFKDELQPIIAEQLENIEKEMKKK